jgi:hypothetical protein
MWRAFPVYRVCTSSRYGISKYRRLEEVTRHRPPDLTPASMNMHQDWILKVAITELFNQPVPDDPPVRSVLEFIKNRTSSLNLGEITEVTLDDNGLACNFQITDSRHHHCSQRRLL